MNKQPEALQYAIRLNEMRGGLFTDAASELRRLHAENQELKELMAAIGAGGVEPLRKRSETAPQAVQVAVPEAIEQMAAVRYKVVPSHESMFHRWAVVADTGAQQLYIGREGECKNMARKFMGAFLDGAFVAMQSAAPPHPTEDEGTLLDYAMAIAHERELNVLGHHHDSDGAVLRFRSAVRRALLATGGQAQWMDAQTIKHISALGELVRMPNAEYFADAHNTAVRHLRTLAAQAKKGE